MQALAVYYTDPVEGRQKFLIPNPTKVEIEHYLWVKEHIESVPEGCALGLFGAIMVIPIRTLRRDWFLDRRFVGQIRIEEIDKPCGLWSDAA